MKENKDIFYVLFSDEHGIIPTTDLEEWEAK